MQIKNFRQNGMKQRHAVAENQAFDGHVQRFLYEWIAQREVTGEGVIPPGMSPESFVEGAALRVFFEQEPKAMEQLLAHPAIGAHLRRPLENVHFRWDEYEPMLAHYEQRIYNLAHRTGQGNISFRYSFGNRQNEFGDKTDIFVTDERGRQVPDHSIECFFGNRRADAASLALMAGHLRDEAARSAEEFPVHVVAEGYLQDSLERVRQEAQRLHELGDRRKHCFIIQRRHAENDMHLGTTLLVIDAARPDAPERVLFCDTVDAPRMPGQWMRSFREKTERFFLLGGPVEDGSAKLQRAHASLPPRHHDLDCGYYSYVIARALIRTACREPELILHGSLEAVKERMTARMPEYYEEPNLPLNPIAIREQNIAMRWETGREILRNMTPRHASAEKAQGREGPRLEVERILPPLNWSVLVRKRAAPQSASAQSASTGMAL